MKLINLQMETDNQELVNNSVPDEVNKTTPSNEMNSSPDEKQSEVDNSTFYDYLILEFNMIKRLLGYSVKNSIREGKEVVKPLDNSLQTKPYVKLLDKITFCLGVSLLVLSQYIFMMRPELMHIFYMLIVIPLVFCRYIIYRMNKWHYFLLDYCYYTNLTLMITLLLIYKFHIISPLFEVVFVSCNGPLLWAIPIWKNSLVFHDLARLTSIAIHYLPAMVTYNLRWRSNLELSQSLSIMTGIIYPLIFYFVWQLLYLIITEVFKKDLIYEDGYMTSTRWLTQYKPHKIFKFAKEKLGIKTTMMVMLLAGQFLLTIGTLIPSMLFYRYRALHTFWMIICFMYATWNGANFYFEVFARRYDAYLNGFKENASELDGTPVNNTLDSDDSDDDDYPIKKETKKEENANSKEKNE